MRTAQVWAAPALIWLTDSDGQLIFVLGTIYKRCWIQSRTTKSTVANLLNVHGWIATFRIDYFSQH